MTYSVRSVVWCGDGTSESVLRLSQLRTEKFAIFGWNMRESDVERVTSASGRNKSRRSGPNVARGGEMPRRRCVDRLVGDAALGCRSHKPHVLAEDAARRFGGRWAPHRAPRGELDVAHLHAQLACVGVDDDAVTVAHERNRT